MIVIEILLFFLSIIFMIMSTSGLGRIISNKITIDNITNVFFGYIFLGMYSTLVHFFFKINFIISISIFIFGALLFIFFNRGRLFLITSKINTIYIVIVFLLIPIMISQKYHEDFGYYHLPYAISFLKEKIIFGFANANFAYIYNSIWLNISSLFFLKDNNFNFLTLHSFILYLTFVIFLCKNILTEQKFSLSNIFSILVLFYFLLKYSRISEYGVDLPAAIFAILSLIYFLKFFETDDLNKKNSYFFCNVSFSVFAILIKLSVLPILILTIYLFFKFYFLKNYLFLKLNFIIIYTCFFLFFIQQFIYTGCIIFPSNSTCLDLGWSNNEFLIYKNKLELINKSYSTSRSVYSPEEYLSNFNWVAFWLKRNFAELAEHVLTMVVPILLYLIFLRSNMEISKLNFKIIFIILLLFFFNLAFWLIFSPVYRFAIHLFLIFSFLSILIFFQKKEFSKNVFLIFLCICLSFNFFKNMNRLSKKNEIFIGIEKIENKYRSDQNSLINSVQVFIPDIEKNTKNGWQGRLCWDIPFVCSYNKLNISKTNNYLIFKKFHD